MRITKIHHGGVAEKIGLRARDIILSVNDMAIRDVIDFYYHANDDVIRLQIERDHEKITIEPEGGFEGWFGAEFETFEPRCCGNHCPFCFIDQNPPGLRSSLYFKDEDYRLSFLYGNYVTLSNASAKDLQRIVDQSLSPVYISVHCTDPACRRRLLGRRRDDRILPKILFLAEHGITMHTQIVLCPGLNDGDQLEQSVNTLADYYPRIKTVAVVPVGLTRHREGLPSLRPVDGGIAETMIEWAHHKASTFKKKLGEPFVYLADEFYLLAQKPLPAAGHYSGFEQIENGVGMTRLFIDRFQQSRAGLPLSIPPQTFSVVTGALAAPVLDSFILPEFGKIEGMKVRLHIVGNRFFGESVGVSGLLTGSDIVDHLRAAGAGDVVLLPSNLLNDDALLLDDWTVPDIEEALDREVRVLDHFTELFE